MRNKTILCKIGGSILDNPSNLKNTISQLKSLFHIQKPIDNIVIIPGGGDFANLIRYVDDKLDLNEDLSHWAAICAMNYNGIKLSKQFPSLKIISDFQRLQKLINKKKEISHILIFLPFNFLFETDSLPHNWDVTSDTISIFITIRLGLERVYLIKNVDGIYTNTSSLLKIIKASEFNEISLKDIQSEHHNQISTKIQSAPIDRCSLDLITQNKIRCIILNGSKNKNNILSYFESSEQTDKIFTEIY